ncbi:chitin synthase-domain-containing protein [Thamnocephalis sphaerospora]|uniref:chitin synthase n=1 Tax=Thamnocephalis sphaerospora TaxID=78915 RepID=A0A4P9XTS6_9FUNG|nr:chitin synthase-domain-containing protein [Thamnocephalis sphaerospora]|eukprot:RKP09587.1 chitin synthase-domain-containing protein [Thamnocephalis sphaerospora]
MSDETAKQYAKEYRDVDGASAQPLPSHIFSITAKAYRHLRRLGQDQGIILTGISGSGKSESHKSLVRQLCLLAAHSKKDAKMHAQVQQALQVLEAFGNARTATNPNASFYGLFEELQFSERGRVVGAKFLPFGLEKSRLISAGSSERIFHAFYYMLAGASAEERQRWHLRDVSGFAYLRTRSANIPGVDDALRYQELVDAMRVCGMKSRARDQVFQLLAAILHLGELEFDDGELSDDACVVRNHDQLEIVAALLGVTTAALETALTYQTKRVRNDVCTVLLNPEAARRHRDGFACSLYALLFAWLVECLNQKLCREDDTVNIVALLNAQGFRAPASGGAGDFETLVANLAAERVQAYASSRALDGPVDAEMREDGVQVPRVMCVDNSACVELLRGGAGKDAKSVLSTIDAESAKSESRRSEAQLVAKLNKQFSSHSHFARPAKDGAWAISHFAGQVTYADADILEKNLDVLSPDLVSVCRDSKSPFIVELFSSMAVATEANPRAAGAIVAAQQSSKPMRAPSRRVKREATRLRVSGETANANTDEDEDNQLRLGENTLVRQIDATLSELFATLDECCVWNAYHIRPNSGDIASGIGGGPPQFDAAFAEEQVRALMLAQLARQKQTTPNIAVSFSHDEFLQRFASVIESIQPNRSQPVEQIVKSAAAHNGWADADIRTGRTRVFLSEYIWKQLENALRQMEKNNRATRKNYAGDGGGSTAGSVYSGVEGSFPGSGPVVYGQAGSVFGTGTYGHANDDIQSMISTDEYFEMRNRGMIAESHAHLKNMWDDDDNDRVKPDTGQNSSSDGTEEEEEVEISRQRRYWVCCTWALTWWIPECCIIKCGRMKREDIRMAWREKVAICIIIFLFCLISVLYIVLLPSLLCPKMNMFSPEEVSYHQGTDDLFMSIHGIVYDVSFFARNGHGTVQRRVSQDDMLQLAGMDVTPLFPLPLTETCPGLVTKSYVEIKDNRTLLLNAFVHRSGDDPRVDVTSTLHEQNWYADHVLPTLKRSKKGRVAFDPKRIADEARINNRRWCILGDDVIDLTYYYDTLADPAAAALNLTDFQYLSKAIDPLFSQYNGQDNTERFMSIKPAATREAIRSCMLNNFKVGVVDLRKSLRCLLAEYLLLTTACFLVAVILAKFLAALQLGTRRNPEDHDKFVICQVPCYTEGEESLEKAFQSLVALDYDDKRKLIFIISDGMIVGSGNDRPTPRIVLDILGVDPKYDPDPLPFKSIGEGANQLNYGKVYSGLYEYEGHVVPYLVVVKVGRPTETRRPGNRGKRDSQIVLMRFLNRVHFDRPMSPLELEVFHQLKNVIGVHPSFYEYILMVDADTQVTPQSLNRLISCMLHDQKIMGICGETRLANEDLTWATMIQVYEYYISHHMAKAFESLFGSVTCLPGCFCMYRVRTPVKSNPLIIADSVVDSYAENHVDTLHKKNLLALGEDRYLTTLMLKFFPQYKMTFTPDATCETAAPEKWSILLSQRRRWINSTIHNLVELLFLQDLCGFCCFSMRFVVMIDLLGTVLMPSSLVYIGYLIYLLIDAKQTGVAPGTSFVSLIILAAVYGLQAVIFILKRQWQHVGWMIIYLLAMPIFAFLIPVYSFWHFDDFSWGNTRVVLGENNKKKIVTVGEEERFDPRKIPMKTWTEYEQGMWETNSCGSRESRGTSYTHHTYKSRAASQAGESVVGGGSQYGDSPYRVRAPLDGVSQGPQTMYASSTMGGGVTQSEYRFSNDYSAVGEVAGTFASTGAVDPRHSAAYNAMDSHGHARSEYEPSVIMGTFGNNSRPMSSFSAAPSVAGFSAQPSDEQLVAEIRQILLTSDLMTITKKQVREQLSQMHGIDLTPRKDFINSTIELILQNRL